MRIPGGGDLAPARRRRYGGSYGRRRRQRNLRLAAVVVVLLAVAAGGAYVLKRDNGSAPAVKVVGLPTCTPAPGVSPAPQTPQAPGTVRLPAPAQVRLMVLNGTGRGGLAKTVADQLARRGFVVTGQGNAPAALTGASTVTYGTGGQPAGTVVTRWLPGSKIASGPRVPAGTVQVVLGSAFTRLATPAEVAQAATPATPARPATPAKPAPRSSARGCA